MSHFTGLRLKRAKGDIMENRMKLADVTMWALEQAPIGEQGTTLPSVSGINKDAEVTEVNLITNLQSVLNNAATTNTGWTLSGVEKAEFMQIINNLDFSNAVKSNNIREGVRTLLEQILEVLRNMHYINLTTHVIRIHPTDCKKNEVIVSEPSGEMARVETIETDIDTEFPPNIKVISREFGEVTGIPEPKPNTLYLVSSIVLSATDRKDVAAPDTGPTAIRDDAGNVHAVTRLVMNA